MELTNIKEHHEAEMSSDNTDNTNNHAAAREVLKSAIDRTILMRREGAYGINIGHLRSIAALVEEQDAQIAALRDVLRSCYYYLRESYNNVSDGDEEFDLIHQSKKAIDNAAHDARIRADERKQCVKVFQDFMSSAGGDQLDARLCCDGRQCGCYGATERDQLIHYGSAFIRTMGGE